MNLRPTTFSDFTGQAKLLEKLKVITTAATLRKEPLRHVLLQGPPGLGKTTLANIIANELKSPIRITSGPVLEKPHMIVGLLSGLSDNSIVFIDEIHRIPRSVEEYLYSAMEDSVLDIVIDGESSQKTIRIQIPPFTLVGATTLPGMLSAPLLSRFPVTLQLTPYSLKDLEQVATRNLKTLKLDVDPKGIKLLATCSRGTPRILNNFIQFLHDLATTKKITKIPLSIVEESLALLEVNHSGLNSTDLKLLNTIKEVFKGGPVGMKSIAMSMGEEEITLSNVNEPFLVTQGYIERTSRGRVLTHKGESFLATGS